MQHIFINYSLLILFLPLVAFVIQIFFGKRLPRQGDWVSIGAISITLILAITMFVKMLLDYDPEFSKEASFVWLDMGAFNIRLGFLVDNITIIMLLVVALISTCTHIFSTQYLEEAEKICDRIAILNKGSIVALDSTKNLINRIKTKKVTFKINSPIDFKNTRSYRR